MCVSAPLACRCSQSTPLVSQTKVTNLTSPIHSHPPECLIELVFHLSQVIYEYIIVLSLGSDTCKRIQHIIVRTKVRVSQKSNTNSIHLYDNRQVLSYIVNTQNETGNINFQNTYDEKLDKKSSYSEWIRSMWCVSLAALV